MTIDPRHAEAERQRRLVQRLLAPDADPEGLATREHDARALRGLQAYRANADASAARALAGAHPTVEKLIGADDFALLARDHWRADPPQHGDLGEWGAGFADFVAADPRLAEWPWLADCARLDWALHRCERAADTGVDASSMARLGDTDPARLVLVLADGVAVVESAWPIAMIRAAHRGDDERAFIAVSEAIAEGKAEAVLVARDGWKAVPQVVDAACAAWTRRLLHEPDLAAALADAPAGFDFAAWLAAALSHAWVKEIRVLAD